MSQIKLSGELLREIREALHKNDPQAADTGIALQYLAALTGYILGGESAPESQKQGYFEELTTFARHVMDGTIQQVKQREASAQESAFGYWEPPGEG
jgi:hypothetical protein